MTKKIIVLASDHAGFALKEEIKAFLGNNFAEYGVMDIGTTNDSDSVNYPVYGEKAAKYIANKQADLGIIICGSGIGISIAANRNKEVRAALCHNAELAKLARQHNDANILALGARVIDENTAKQCVNIFLTTEFDGGRHQKRVDML